ncbi:MAG: hypothetical protein QM784_32325 [Polyangiaceae bacterium]
MLVYRDTAEQRDTREWLSSLAKRISASPRPAQSRDLLIEFGIFESALLDALAARQDSAERRDVVRALRRVCSALAARFNSEYEDTTRCSRSDHMNGCEIYLERLKSSQLPPELHATRPEGYAYWGLYPEQYLDAARCFLRAVRPRSAFVIGARSIGTSLSSVVESYLASRGVSTESLTVRPIGHPFDRQMHFESSVHEQMKRIEFEYFLVVDEGPGMSGSTLASIAKALTRLGIPREHVVLFPSYDTDGSSFVNDEARVIWQQHLRFLGTFDPARLVPGTVDVSAGRWRDHFIDARAERLLVVPHHERRKYVELSSAGAPIRIHRYCGLGPIGTATHTRALVLQESGYVPRVGHMRDGLMEVHFVPGKPLEPARASPRLLETIANYLAFRGDALRSRSSEREALVGMLRNNVEEGLGAEYLPNVDSLAEAGATDGDRCCYVDGRMQAHEWIRNRIWLHESRRLRSWRRSLLPRALRHRVGFRWCCSGARSFGERALNARSPLRTTIRRQLLVPPNPVLSGSLPCLPIGILRADQRSVANGRRSAKYDGSGGTISRPP